MAKRSGLGRGVEAFYGGIGSVGSEKEDVTAKIEPEEKKTAGKKAEKTGKSEEPSKPVKSKTEKISVSKSKESKAAAKTSPTKTSDTKVTATPATEVSETKKSDGKGASEKTSDVKKTSVQTSDAPAGGDALQARDSDAVAMVKLTRIEPNRDQPRKDFEEEGLQELAESLRNHGLIQPILVRPKGDFYEIVAGERRWRAARMAGMKEVPVIIRKEYTDADVAEIALVENLQRKDLNPIEEAKAYQALIEVYHLTQEEVAFRVSKKRTSITNSLRLLKLHPSVQEMLQSNTISMGHAKVLLSLDTADQQLMVALLIAQDDLSVRQTEIRVHEILNPKPEKTKKALPDQLIYQDLETRLGSSVNSKVVIHRTNSKKGKIEISYTSLEELERIAELLGVKM